MPWSTIGNIRGPQGTQGPAGTNAADPWTTLKTVADVPVTTITAVDITALGFTPAPNTLYLVEAYLIVVSAAATTGIKLGLSLPASGVTGAWNITVANTAAAANDLYTNATGTLTANTVGLTTPTLAKIEALLTAGASIGAGTIRPVLASEIAASAVTVKAGSVLRYRIL